MHLQLNRDKLNCLRAEGRCTINLDFRNLTLTNCERCLQAAGNADVRLSTAGTLRCTASRDGILAEGTASVTLRAASLAITAGERGIRAAGTADVNVLLAGTADVLLNPANCTINGNEGPVRIDGNATIDGCGF